MGQIGLSAPSIDGSVPSDLIGPFYHEQDIINERFELVDGEIRVPAGVGLGVTLNRDAVKKYRTDNK
jgi:L-alanine-DL-glutamate epimerase-like enolase superfamily enzyme